MKKQKSSILIFILLVLITLMISGIIFSSRESNGPRVARRGSYSVKAMYLARACVMKMIVELARDTNAYDSLNEDWNRDRNNPKELTLSNDTVLYGATDENSRLNLNSKALKKEQIIRLGVDDTLASEILEYKKAKGTKGFEFMEELFLVDDMTQENFSKIKDSVTIYRGVDPEININTASEMVLEAIVEDAGIVQKILDYRKGADGEEYTDDDGFKDASDISMIEGLDQSLFTVRSNVYRIWSQCLLSDDKNMVNGAEAIVDKESGRIYHWNEY